MTDRFVSDIQVLNTADWTFPRSMMVPFGDDELVTSKCPCYLLEHPDERQTMGEAGFERLSELEVTWENHARKVSAIHREILG